MFLRKFGRLRTSSDPLPMSGWSRGREFKCLEGQSESVGVEVGVVAADRTGLLQDQAGRQRWRGRKAEADAPGKFGNGQASVLLQFANVRHGGKAWLPILIDGSIPKRLTTDRMFWLVCSTCGLVHQASD